MISKHIKYSFLFLLIFLLGAESGTAKTKLIFLQNQVCISLDQAKKINIRGVDSGDLSSQATELYTYYYHPFQPIIVYDIEDNEKLVFNGKERPAFFFMGMENIKQEEAVASAWSFIFDTSMLLTGVGELNALRKMTGVAKITRATILGTQISSATIRILLDYSKICEGNEKDCEAIREALFWVEIASFSADVFTQQMVRRSAKRALKGKNIPKNIKDELEVLAGAKKLANGVDDLSAGLKNTLKTAGIEASVLSKLDNWKPATLTKFDDVIKNSNYTGIIDEFKLNADLFDKFKLVEETWWAKYSMAGISKRAKSTTPKQFKKYIGDIEVSVSGKGKLKLKDLSLKDSSPQYLGKLFDDAITQNVTKAWGNGDFSGFPTNIANYLSDLKSKGYKLAVEPQVSILGKNPKPDLLLFGNKKVGAITKKDVVYIEIKYIEDVGYTSAQKAITDNLPATVIKKDFKPLYDNNNVELVGKNTEFTINQVKKLTVDKITLKMKIQ